MDNVDNEDIVFIDKFPSMTLVPPVPSIPQQEPVATRVPSWAISPQRETLARNPDEHNAISRVTMHKAEHFPSSRIEDGVTQWPMPPKKSHRPIRNYTERRDPKHPDNNFPRMIPELPIRSKGPEEGGPPSYLPPPPPPPPFPPPAPGGIQFLNAPSIVSPLPPPPPPPPPPGAFQIFVPPPAPEDEVFNPRGLLPPQYPSGSMCDHNDRVIHMTPFRRNAFITHHRAHPADYREHEWIIEHGSPELWYAKPSRLYLKSLEHIDGNRPASNGLLPLMSARPVSLETPKIWASDALTRPLDDDVFGCTAGHHTIDDSIIRTCHDCTDAATEAIESTPLVYYLVLSTYQANEPFVQKAHFNGNQIYKLVKGGSREAVVSEAFYAAGVMGWNIAFSCVMRLGEDFEERAGPVKRLQDLRALANEAEDADTIRVFY